jgi:arsenite methyltransferase
VRLIRAGQGHSGRAWGVDGGRCDARPVTVGRTPRARFAGQLRHPRGLTGLAVGALLNRRNGARVLAAVEALAPLPAEEVADLGFGGGLSLQPLLDAVGPEGRVHGVDISRVSLQRAARRHRRAIAAGRLRLHEASMGDLRLPDASIQGLMTVNTIYFVEDGVFAEPARVLAPGGRLVVGFGDPETMTRSPVAAHGFTLRPVTRVRELLTTAGLTVTEHHRVGPGTEAFHLLLATQP